MSMDIANFNVPEFKGFEVQGKDEEVDNYFEYDHENLQRSRTESATSSEIYSFDWDALEKSPPTSRGMRKSMSTGNLLMENEEKRQQELVPRRNRQPSECNAVIGHMKSLKRSGQKYESMAEMAANFWLKTPERFRGQQKMVKAVYTTIARTPLLTTKNRSRPVTALSRDQMEELQMKEAQKHQFKARPVNKKMLSQPTKPMPAIKHKATVLKPFKLTEVHTKKIDNTPTVAPEFHAKPIPKSIYTAPKDLRPLVRPISRCISKTKLNEHTLTTVKPLTKTELAPFSFDKRDKNMVKKKEDYIHKIMEEEKKAREFRAKPIPKVVLSNLHNATSTSSIRSSKSDDSIDVTSIKPFKAAFPKVLYHEPFLPKKSDQKPLVEIPFQLNTQLRAKERERFDKQQQEKQENINRLRAENEQREKEKEEDCIQKLRKQTQFKANPIRRFKEMEIQPSGKITLAMSPNIKKYSNKENVTK